MNGQNDNIENEEKMSNVNTCAQYSQSRGNRDKISLEHMKTLEGIKELSAYCLSSMKPKQTNGKRTADDDFTTQRTMVSVFIRSEKRDDAEDIVGKRYDADDLWDSSPVPILLSVSARRYIQDFFKNVFTLVEYPF